MDKLIEYCGMTVKLHGPESAEGDELNNALAELQRRIEYHAKELLRPFGFHVEVTDD